MLGVEWYRAPVRAIVDTCRVQQRSEAAIKTQRHVVNLTLPSRLRPTDTNLWLNDKLPPEQQQGNGRELHLCQLSLKPRGP